MDDPGTRRQYLYHLCGKFAELAYKVCRQVIKNTHKHTHPPTPNLVNSVTITPVLYFVEVNFQILVIQGTGYYYAMFLEEAVVYFISFSVL